MNKPIVSKRAPKAVGPYVHAVDTGNMLFCSGQLGIDPATGEFKVGVAAQTKQCLKNLSAVLKEAGYDINDVVKTLIFIDHMEDFPIMNEVYSEFFGDHKPARSCVEAAKIPKGALVEIECIAVKSE